jgi:hypothetical protein
VSASESSGPSGGPPPYSGQAIAGLVLSLLCCTPVGLGFTIVGHGHIRHGERRGRGVVLAGYIASGVVTLLMVGTLIAAFADLRSETDRYVGDWRTAGELRWLGLDISAVEGGATIDGTFEERRMDVRCSGSFDERTRTVEGAIEIELDGRCDDGSTVDERLELRIEDGGDTLVTDDGRKLHRRDG